MLSCQSSLKAVLINYSGQVGWSKYFVCMFREMLNRQQLAVDLADSNNESSSDSNNGTGGKTQENKGIVRISSSGPTSNVRLEALPESDATA